MYREGTVIVRGLQRSSAAKVPENPPVTPVRRRAGERRDQKKMYAEALNLSITLGRNDAVFSCGKQRLDDAFIGIESLVCQQGVSLHLGQKFVGTLQIMGLPRMSFGLQY
jgi:hypothetical protein